MWIKKIAVFVSAALLVSQAAAQHKPGGTKQKFPKKIKDPHRNNTRIGLDLQDHDYDDEPIYPQFSPFPTFKELNDTVLIQVTQCLSDWCEQDYFLNADTGKARCVSERLPSGHRHVVYACNFRQAARCSKRHIEKALGLVREEGSQSGTVTVRSDKRGRMIFKYGFDLYCDGGESCGKHYDPVAMTCDEGRDFQRLSPFQYDQEVSQKYLDSENKPGPVYEGITWISEPTASPTHQHLAYPTVTAT
ncbi:hypothetical protein B0T19DRAFT_445967 [Cercophora scortea]|uniref:Uncharacterized protein n=1 Tax=Cercophora scortea TaxID=314031 RepID=A0AAE0M6Y8_9PEZI|nr:hypothetical protein B0T19DRAFT_445967 [Cercophora scortea]